MDEITITCCIIESNSSFSSQNALTCLLYNS